MRVDRRGVGVDEHLEYVFAAELRGAPFHAFVALAQQVLDLRHLFAGQLETQGVVFHPFAPQIVELRAISRPRRFVATEHIGLVQIKIEIALEQTHGVTHALLESQAIATEDFVDRTQIGLTQKIIEFRLVALEHGDVGGREIAAVRVEALDVSLEDLTRERVVERRLFVVIIAEEMGDQSGCAAVLNAGLKLL